MFRFNCTYVIKVFYLYYVIIVCIILLYFLCQYFSKRLFIKHAEENILLEIQTSSTSLCRKKFILWFIKIRVYKFKFLKIRYQYWKIDVPLINKVCTTKGIIFIFFHLTYKKKDDIFTSFLNARKCSIFFK